MNYWPPIVGMHPDNHVLHTFLSFNLSFPSLNPVTSLITSTNNGKVFMNYTFGRNDFKLLPGVGCSKIITPTVNITVYDSLLFQCCNRHRELPGNLSFNSLTLEPSCHSANN